VDVAFSMNVREIDVGANLTNSRQMCDTFTERAHVSTKDSGRRSMLAPMAELCRTSSWTISP
jgi:hypothetical protein